MKGIKYEVTGQNGNIGIITLNRPAALNAMNTETVNEMRQLLSEINEDENIRCLILTGEGGPFVRAGTSMRSRRQELLQVINSAETVRRCSTR